MTPEQASLAALQDYASESGRSVLVRVRTPARAWEHGIDHRVSYPAASVLKLAIGLAIEQGFRQGTVDPEARLPVAEVGVRDEDRSVLSLLDPTVLLSVADMLRLTLGSSDNACARMLVGLVGESAVHAAVDATGCQDTRLEVSAHMPAGIGGTTSCADALTLLSAVLDTSGATVAAHALRHSTLNSRIPLGAQDSDVRIAHKTGTLRGLAHDVARIEADGGTVDIAFLSDEQHDTLVTGYAMGICTHTILEAWGLSVRRTTSVLDS